jgi:translation initiation factor IF-2
LLELKADPEAELRAVVVESFKNKMTGPVADVIVQSGTLELRQEVFTQEASGRVRAIMNDMGKPIKMARPGDPGRLIGFSEVPGVGSIIQSNSDFSDLEEAVAVAAAENSGTGGASQRMGAGVKKNAFTDLDFSVLDKNVTGPRKIVLIVRADTQGTLEAIVNNLDSESVTLVEQGVGGISDTDLELAKTTGARIIAFQVKVDNRIVASAKTLGVRIKQYQVIYELIEDLQKQMLKLMEPTIDEKVVGEAEILQIFEMKGLRIAGIKVRTGELKKADLFHIKRGEEILANPVINTMMKDKMEVTNIKAGNEGAVTFKNKKLGFEIGDI